MIPIGAFTIERSGVEHALANAGLPFSLRHLRGVCRLRMAILCDVLTTLRTEGRVLKAADGYRLAPR